MIEYEFNTKDRTSRFSISASSWIAISALLLAIGLVVMK